MAKENLFESILPNFRQHIKTAVLIATGLLILTPMINKVIHPLYENEIILRVKAADLATGENVSSVMYGILAQKTFWSEVLHVCGIEASTQLSYIPFSIEEVGEGLVKLTVRNPNPDLISELGDSAIRVLSSKFLTYLGGRSDFEIETLEKKKTTLSSKVCKVQNKSLETDGPTLFPTDPESLEEEMLVLGTRIQEDKKRLQTLPRVRVVPSEATDKALSEVSQELTEAKAYLNLLFETYREKHPKVIAAKERIELLQKRQRTLSAQKDKKEPNPEFEALQQEIECNEAKLEELKKQWLEANRIPDFQTKPAQTSVFTKNTLNTICPRN